MTAHQQTLNADNELAVPFSFSFLVKEYAFTTNMAFNRVLASQYVQLTADLAIANLSTTAPTQAAGVAATVTTPPVPAATSTAGAAPLTSLVAPGNSLQQLSALAQTQATTGASPTGNVYGVVSSTPPTPPAPP